MSVTVLSPHPGDAVLSCWHVLAGPLPARVVNVFAGMPGPGLAPAGWDRLTGAEDPRRRSEERLHEDLRALASRGVTPLNLDFVRDEYRDKPLDPAAVGQELAAHMNGVVYAPAALSGQPDHLVTRSAALALRERGVEVRLYAELPWSIAFGWPGWVTGRADVRFLRIERQWATALATVGLDLSTLPADVHDLGAAEPSKRATLQAYRTQQAALQRMFPPEGLRYEMSWSIS